MTNVIKNRIKELRSFLVEANKYSNVFEIPDELYNKYNISPRLVTDKYYNIEVIEIIIDELERILNGDNI